MDVIYFLGYWIYKLFSALMGCLCREESEISDRGGRDYSIGVESFGFQKVGQQDRISKIGTTFGRSSPPNSLF
jgi:hypothetical protein